ncbi:Lar family restriction alleviation protein [Burkholderia anthina]|uniref:Lar family restriction alleviation protein n=1 Tax=Burkholderia anthina TaxID=179879 RepID=A0A6P2GFW9_9BURK|nr:Lar family restriction alleviation protein [Burkholderia anthina]MBM2769880.1 Lar family restriction alleviation protein [Burkholderia anthina]VVU51854.1 hypothetical protein BAN20980_04577 [Burkholderia anthina]
MTTTDKSRADALTDLLPCPFCGSAASLNSDHIDYFVLCDTCSGEGPRLQSPTGNHEASKRGAIAAWNARAPVETMSADALKTIAEFPITDPANMDALNMRKIAADAIAAPVEQHEAAPIPMLLFCPRCGEQHIDAPEEHEYDAGLSTRMEVSWTNPPHRSHRCHACYCSWRPADVATIGVASIETRGKEDTWTAEQGSIADVDLAAFERPAPSAPLEGTGNGADERAMFNTRITQRIIVGSTVFEKGVEMKYVLAALER